MHSDAVALERAEAHGHTMTEHGWVTKNQAWALCTVCKLQYWTDIDPYTNERKYHGPALDNECISPKPPGFCYLVNPTTGLMRRNIRSAYKWILRHRKDIRYARIIRDPDAWHDVSVEITLDDYNMLWFSFGDYHLCEKMMRRLVFPTTVDDRTGEDCNLWYSLVP